MIVRERTGKVTQHTFIPLFLRVQGLLHHAANLAQVHMRQAGINIQKVFNYVAIKENIFTIEWHSTL